ncbi:MAG: Hsp70 family protein, partial [Acidimicrobiia bacterium]
MLSGRVGEVSGRAFGIVGRRVIGVMTVVGVDVGTTFSAAAVADGGGVRVFELSERAAAMPSVVVLSESGDVLVGEPAVRRARLMPERSAREFKRRLGDPTPLLVGGTPYGAEALMAEMFGCVRRRVVEWLGAEPEGWVVCHPANWGPHRLDLLGEACRIGGLENVSYVSEPVAAAVQYASQERVRANELIGVFDLGGGTFDAAVVARTEDGEFDILGSPEGLDRFGGIDLDHAVFGHVERSLGGVLEDLDTSDPATLAALAQLRDECRLAKEALSSDTEVTIPVALPTVHTQVRLTRTEFEDLVRPRLRDTIAAFERAVSSAGVEMSDLSRVLLVGGSSRIPLVADMVRSATDLDIALDTHPKHATCLGAAIWGSTGTAPGAAVPITGVSASAAVASVVSAPDTAPPVRDNEESSSTEHATKPVDGDGPPPIRTDTGSQPIRPLGNRTRTATLVGAGALVVLLLIATAAIARTALTNDEAAEPQATITTATAVTTTTATAPDGSALLLAEGTYQIAPEDADTDLVLRAAYLEFYQIYEVSLSAVVGLTEEFAIEAWELTVADDDAGTYYLSVPSADGEPVYMYWEVSPDGIGSFWVSKAVPGDSGKREWKLTPTGSGAFSITTGRDTSPLALGFPDGGLALVPESAADSQWVFSVTTTTRAVTTTTRAVTTTTRAVTTTTRAV